MMEGVKTFQEVGRENRGGIQDTKPHLTALTACFPHFPAPSSLDPEDPVGSSDSALIRSCPDRTQLAGVTSLRDRAEQELGVFQTGIP